METSFLAVPQPKPLAATNVSLKTNSQALQAIGLFKLLKAVLFFAAAAGMFTLVHRDTQVELIRFLKVFRLSHDRALVKSALVSANLLDDPHKKIAGYVLGMYGLLFMTEGIGLMLRKRWAEWFTSILTFTGIPLEIYEVQRHYTLPKVGVLIINILILAFLILHLVRTSRRHSAVQPEAITAVPMTPRAGAEVV